MLRVYSGKFFGAIDESEHGFGWSLTLADNNLPEETAPIAQGVSRTMEEALTIVYERMAKAIATKGGHETERD